MNKYILIILLSLGSYISINSIYLLDIISSIAVLYLIIYFIKYKTIVKMPVLFNLIYSIFMCVIAINTILIHKDIKGFIKWSELYILILGTYTLLYKYNFTTKDICEILILSNIIGISLAYVTLFSTGSWVKAKWISRQSVIYVVLGVITVLKSNNKISIKNYIFILLSILLTIITKSRGNLLGLIFIMSIVFTKDLYQKIISKNSFTIKFVVKAKGIIVLIILSFILFPGIYRPYIDILETLNISKYKTASNVERSEMIELAIDIIKDRPFAGIGTGNFGRYYLGYDSDLIVHNVFLQIGIEYGVIAMIMFIFIVMYNLYNSVKFYKYNKYYKYICISMFIIVYDFMVSVFSGDRRIIFGLIIASIMFINSKNRYELYEGE